MTNCMFENKDGVIYYGNMPFFPFGQDVINNINHDYPQDAKKIAFNILLEHFQNRLGKQLPSSHTIYLKHFIDNKFEPVEDMISIMWKNFWR